MDTDKILEIQNKIVPETAVLLMRRYEILKIISSFEPVGRRSLANKLGISERTMRTEIDRLKELNLIQIHSDGVKLTDMGIDILSEVHNTFYYIKNLSDLEIKLKDKLKLKRVVVVAGDTENDSYAFRDLGKKAAEIILDFIKSDTVLGITGGTTMACTVNHMKSKKGLKNLLVLPARGGLSEELEIQANTIAANLAEKLDASYKLLHIPDNLDKAGLDVLKSNKLINEVLEDIKKINLLVFGLGDAKKMAVRRKSDKEVLKRIECEKLTAEAFGYFFDQDGNLKIETNSVGITLDNFKAIKNAIGVAAGCTKAEAIYAFSKFNSNFILVTDEAAAIRILEL